MASLLFAGAASDALAQAETSTQELLGIQVEVTYTADLFSPMIGGRSRRVTYSDNLDVTAMFRLTDLIGGPGTTLFLYGLGNQGGSPSAAVGDLQGVSNIEAPNSWKLYEAWVEQRLLANRLSVLLGLYDLNSEFDFPKTGQLFLHSSHGMGPDLSQSGRNGPSTFPTTALAMRFKARPSQKVYLQGAILDGVPGDPAQPRGTHVKLGGGDGVLVAMEGGLLIRRPGAVDGERLQRERTARRRRIGRDGAASYQAKVGLGIWVYTADFRELAKLDAAGEPVERAGTVGMYALMDAPVRSEADPEQGLRIFGRAGIADNRVNRIGLYLGGGIVYAGPFAGRDDDAVGLGLAIARNGASFKRARERSGILVEGAEVAWELTYRARVTRWLDAQVDLQYVANPDTDPSIPNALIWGTRVQFTF